MQAFLTNERIVFFRMLLLVASIVVMFWFNWSNGTEGKLLFVVYALIVVVALFLGTLPSLILSLLLLFAVGTLLLVLAFQTIEVAYFTEDAIPLPYFVLYGAGLLVTNVVAGMIHHQVKQLVQERNSWKQQVKQYITLDPTTFFDNADRLELELKREMMRIKRHGGKLSILFLQLDHYREFLKAYGPREMDHLLKAIGKKADEALRFSDRKFRYSDNKFAFILVETRRDDVEIVAEKLGSRLREHQLLNSKTVTLEFHISYEEYNEQMEDVDYLDFIQGVERESIYYDL